MVAVQGHEFWANIKKFFLIITAGTNQRPQRSADHGKKCVRGGTKAGCVEDRRYHRGIHPIGVKPRCGTKLPSLAYKIRLHGNARPGGQSDEPHMIVECLFWCEMLGCGSGFRPHMVDAQGVPCSEFPKHGQPALGVKKQVMVARYPQDLVEVGGQKIGPSGLHIVAR